MSVAKKLAEINQRKREIEEVGAFSEEVRRRINYRFRLDWNYYSNRMEGGTLTREETRSIMVGNIDVHRKPVKDVMEMSGHDRVVREMLSVGKGEKRLSEKRIKDIHRAIMHEEDESKAQFIGEWKKEPNEIINYQNEKIDFCPPNEVAEQMHQLLDRTNAAIDHIERGKKDAPHPVLLASNFQIDYLTIHPFYDGNGRTARILSNLILIAHGLPPVVVTDEEKQIYYRYLSDIQTHSSGRQSGDRNLFHEFMCDLVLRSLQLVQDAIAGKDLTQEEDVEKELRLIEQQLKLKAEETPIYTLERAKEIIDHSLLPLFNELREKLKPFERLFERQLVSISVDGNKNWKKETLPFVIDYDELSEQKQPVLKCILLYRELKGIATKIDVEITFMTHFPHDHYSLGEQLSNTRWERKYNQPFTQDERNEIISKIQEAFLKKLKQVANGD
ncbi:MAG: Fic family protein [Cyclobacteriaceae bacterium]